MGTPSIVTDYDETVTVVLITYNDAAFLREAISSVINQRRPADEIIVVDDGSEVSPAPLIAEFQDIILLRKSNGGPSSARNAGLHRARSRYITFLDADDRLEPNAIATGIACFARRPEAAMVYGGYRRIQADGKPLGRPRFKAVGKNAYADLLTSNRIGMLATVLYRREILLELGGFDEGLRRCEDYDLYLRLARSHSIATHPEIIAEYRWHGRNTSSDTPEMLRAALAVYERHRPQNGALLKAWNAGQRNCKAWYTTGQRRHWDGKVGRAAVSQMLQKLLQSLVRRVNLDALGTTRPISLDFGWDRGTPIDRYYLENFLALNTADVRGRVLEIGDDAYSRRYGGSKITKQDVLHLDVKHPKATLVGDLTQPNVLPDDAFDCILLTQTLQLIFDLDQAVRRLHGSLKPGGVLLLTVGGISQIDRGQWRDHWCWSFTGVSIRKLFEPYFASEMEIKTHGNVFAATAFLQGMALEEVDRAKLDVHDPAYPVVITLRAQKR
jgi:GT2 family glycosyltransferase